MTLAHARALFPPGQLLAGSFTPQRDEQSLHHLAMWAARFSPRVAPDPPDGLILDVTGCERLFGGEEKLAWCVMHEVARLGFTGRVAIAPTIGSAWAAARLGEREVSCLSPHEVAQVLAPMPVAALRVEDAVTIGLLEVGVERIGELMNIPRRQLAARFGGGLLRRMDQALGKAAEVMEPMRPREAAQVEQIFGGPTTDLSTIIAAARHLITALVALLRQREQGALRLRMELIRPHLDPVHVPVKFSHPSRDGRHWWCLIAPRLERVHMGAGVECVRLIAPRTRTLPHEQRAIGGRDSLLPDPSALQAAARIEAVGELIDLLATRIGNDRVLRLEPVARHLPEQAFRFRSAIEATESGVMDGIHPPRRRGQSSRSGAAKPGHAKQAARRGMQQAAAAASMNVPSSLCPIPERIEVTAMSGQDPGAGLQDPAGRLRWLRWAGDEHEIISMRGPTRIAGPWWKTEQMKQACVSPPVSTRDYFELQTAAGHWLWVFHELESDRWFVHGQWL